MRRASLPVGRTFLFLSAGDGHLSQTGQAGITRLSQRFQTLGIRPADARCETVLRASIGHVGFDFGRRGRRVGWALPTGAVTTLFGQRKREPLRRFPGRICGALSMAPNASEATDESETLRRFRCAVPTLQDRISGAEAVRRAVPTVQDLPVRAVGPQKPDLVAVLPQGCGCAGADG